MYNVCPIHRSDRHCNCCHSFVNVLKYHRTCCGDQASNKDRAPPTTLYNVVPQRYTCFIGTFGALYRCNQTGSRASSDVAKPGLVLLRAFFETQVVERGLYHDVAIESVCWKVLKVRRTSQTRMPMGEARQTCSEILWYNQRF